MTVVRVHEDEPFETALRKFRHKCKKAGIFTEVRKRRYHEKPSVKNGGRFCLQRDKQLTEENDTLFYSK